MGEEFSVIKRVFENNSLITFIDLLGTRKLYENGQTERQAQKILHVLLGSFNICFSNHFQKDEIENGYFDVSIFADSIVVSQRKSTPNIIERVVNFSLSFQAYLLLNGSTFSRATIIKDSFFSFKVTNPNKKNILGSTFTSISLCGGKGIKLAHDALEGLPIGVYVSKTLFNDLSAEHKERAIPIINDESLLFIKQKYNIYDFLPRETINLMIKHRKPGINAIRNSLKATYPDKDALDKFLPWVLVHLERENKITKCKRKTKLSCPAS